MFGFRRHTSKKSLNRPRTLSKRWRPILEVLEDRTVPTVSYAGPAWVNQGPFGAINGQVEGIVNRPVSGAVQTIAAHPTNADIAWIGTTNGGIWRTNNATAASPSWTPLTDQFPSLSIRSIFLDPTDPTNQTLVAGAGSSSSFFGLSGPFSGMLRSTDGGNSWFRLTDNLNGRDIVSVTAHGSLIFAATTSGLFRSTDTGANFTQIPTGVNGLPNGPAWNIVVDPSNAQRFYVAIGGGSGGVFRTDDGGNNWMNLTSAAQATLIAAGTQNMKLAVHNNTGMGTNAVYFGIINNNGFLGGIFRSGNQGTNWAAMDLPLILNGNFPITNASNASPIVITSANHGLGNGDRVRITGVLGNTAANGDFFVTRLTNNTFSLNGSAGNGAYGGGGNWQKITNLQPNPARKVAGGQGAIHFSMQADRNNSFVVYLGGDRQDLPTDPNSIGATDFTGSLYRGDAFVNPTGAIPSPQWTPLTHVGTPSNSAPHADSRAMVFDANGNMLEADDGGIYRRISPSTNTGDWVSVIGNLANTEFHDIAWDSNSNVIVGGSQDNGTMFQTSTGALTWDHVSVADGGDVAIDNNTLSGANQSIRYTSNQNLGGFRRRTYDAAGAFVGGSEVFPVMTISPGNTFFTQSEGRFVTPVVVNENNGARLIISGSTRLFESTDQGENITSLGNLVANNSDSIDYGGFQNNVANPDVLYIGVGNQVFIRTTNGGALNATNLPLGAGNVESVVMDPRDWSRAVASTNNNRVYLTSNSGGLWTEITGNLVDGNIQSLEFISNNTATTVIAGGVAGIHRMQLSTLGLWCDFDSNMPNAIVYDLDWDAGDDMLVAGLMGRGSWTLSAASTQVMATGTLTINGDMNSANQADSILLQLDSTIPNSLQVFVNSTLVGTYDLGCVSDIIVNGLGGSDILTVDQSNGLVNKTILFNGGTGTNDRLSIVGGTINNLTYNIQPGQGNGQLVMDTATLNFTSLEPVLVTSVLGTVTVNDISGSALTINVQDNGTVGDGLMAVNVPVPFESIVFSNPTVALNVNAGTGNDVVNLFALDSLFTAPTININGGDDSDTIQVFALRAGTTLNVNTANGTPNDRTIIGNTFANFVANNDAGSLATVLGSINVDDSGGVGELYIDDSSNVANTTATVTNASVTVGTLTVNYVAGNIEILQLRTGLGNDSVRVASTDNEVVTTVFLNAGADIAMVDGPNVLGPLTVNGDEGNDTFFVAAGPAVITINGGLPVVGDPGVPPGDKLIIKSYGGTVIPFNSPDGSIITPGLANINFTSIETLILPDRFEINNSVATATFLGSPEVVTLDRLSIHCVDDPNTAANEADVDYFRYTAHSTGYLVVNAVFAAGNVAGNDLTLQIRDAANNILVTRNLNGVDGERLVVPVVSQQVYYIRVSGTNPLVDTNNYNLEIENFKAPVPTVVDLQTASDSGRSDADNITNIRTSVIEIQADLNALANEGIVILTPAQALAGNVSGAAVEIFLNNVSIGFGTVIAGTGNTLFRFTFPAAGFGALLEGVNKITAAVRIFDIQNPVRSGRELLGSPPLFITLDTVAPVQPTLNLNPPDDTGLPGQPATFTDRITKKADANFTGTAELNSSPNLFETTGAPIFLGSTFVVGTTGQYFIDPVISLNDPLFFPEDGLRNISVQTTDVAGNTSQVTTIQIFVDTRGPQVAAVFAAGIDILNKVGPTPLTNSIDILFIDQPVRVNGFVYPAVNQILAQAPGNYALIGKKTGPVKILSVDFFDATFAGDIGQTAVRLNFAKPLVDDKYTLTVFDRVKDVAANSLDGDFFGALPSGDGVPGDSFDVGFTVDAAPELGFYANGSVNLDLNGDFTVNPFPNTGEDAVLPYGPNGAAVFAGQFSPEGAAVVTGFDRLGTYGLDKKKFTLRLDFNDDQDFNDFGEIIVTTLQINGTVVAGNWDPAKAGDEVAVFTGTRWTLDTNGNNDFDLGDTTFAGNMRGLPIAGDFDGDGFDDLGTYQNGTFFFDLAFDGLDGNTDTSFRVVGFPGGTNGVSSKLARPVAADFDRDGIDDVGLFLPNQTTVVNKQVNWYFLVSNDADGSRRVAGSVNTLNHGFKSNQFPGGSLDFSATYGSNKALPVVGNFDPPIKPTTNYQPADLNNIAQNLVDLYFSQVDPFTNKPWKKRR